MSIGRVFVAAGLLFVIGCTTGQPVVVCDETEFTPPSPLECDAAVQAAMAALGDDHPAIARISFWYGNHCPPGWECPMTSSEYGVVYIDFTGFDEDVYVEVSAIGGEVRIRSGPTPGSP